MKKVELNKKKWIATIAWVVFFVAFGVFLYFFNTSLGDHRPGDAEIGVAYEKARVLSVDQEDMGPDPDFSFIQIGKQWVTLELLTGEQAGRSTTAINYVERVNNKPVQPGTQVVVSSYDGFITTTIANYNRESTVYLLAALFLLAILIFGKKKGFTSILSLVFTLICVIFLFLPMIIRGMQPILAAVIVVILSTAVTLLSLNGWSKKTGIAAVSCMACTMLAGVIGYAAGSAGHLSTMNTSEAELLLFVSTDTALYVKDLLFAGILIASLGAVMDTTMSIASALSEMKALNPQITSMQLLRSGMNIGRDMMGTMTNTLILAFTGSSINILLVYYLYALPYIGLINLDLLVVEIIRGLSGSLAVVLSIPITALIASRVLQHGGNPGAAHKGRKAS